MFYLNLSCRPSDRQFIKRLQGLLVPLAVSLPSTLDKDELSNYRPISNLSVISKIIERIVKSRLIDHLISSKLLNPHQSAYCKHHSTETALLYIHTIISSMQ